MMKTKLVKYVKFLDIDLKNYMNASNVICTYFWRFDIW
jgi:hypothetical protein